MSKTIKEQIIAIRDLGETNMFDIKTVQCIADREGYSQLVVYIEEHKEEYLNFIMNGDKEE